MRYLSTRGGQPVSAAGAIVSGISPSGGLYVPEAFPHEDLSDLYGKGATYQEAAFRIMHPYLPETGEEKLRDILKKAYSRFDTEEVTPLHPLNAQEDVLELWHGPTMAFKDVALQMLPHLMRNALDLTGESRTVYILVATSGDTGKAALEGFMDVPGTRVLVFYPYGGVSEAQRLQMVTQLGSNVDVCAVRGNFDDAQTGVKQIFASAEIAERMDRNHCRLSSANSINFGRLLPQIVYYAYSYLRLVDRGTVRPGEAINFCVPTGNFGDILAGEYARRMGIPIRRLICASNRNNVLTDFFRTGLYDSSRPFYRSMSCSIDILISSNLERLVFECCSRDEGRVRELMGQLKETGKYQLSGKEFEKISDGYWAGWCDEEQTLATIRSVFEQYGYLIDPHTAVGQTVYGQYLAETGDPTHTVLLSTASPFKFSADVLSALGKAGSDQFRDAELLSSISGCAVPEGIRVLKERAERFTDVCALDEMPERIFKPFADPR